LMKSNNSTQGLKIPVSLVRFRVRAPYSEEPAYGGFFAFWGTDSPSNCVRLFGLSFPGGSSPISASTQDLAANTRLRCLGKATLTNQKTKNTAGETGQASTKSRVSHSRRAQNSSINTIANSPKGRYRISLR
ncbi:hypothetical protein, partial [Serratia marcescens]|uniref:hypothetical protein n=1 Tax=Serratia marcescens TaxID=615 RepID=UPI001E5216AF